MQVPVLKQSLVQAQPVGTPYAQADVSALSQGGGVAEGVSSIGGVLAGEAITAKKQADQAAVNNATANGRAQGDALWESLRTKDGPAYMESLDPTRKAYADALAQTRAGLKPDQQAPFDAWADSALVEFDARSIARGNDVRIEMGQQALANKVQTNTASAARDAKNIRFSQYAADANKNAPTGTKAPEFVGMGIADSRLREIESAIDEYADANVGHLPTDAATWKRLAKEKARSDFHSAILEGMLTPTPGEAIDDRAAVGYFKLHEKDMEQDDRTRWQDNLDRANTAGSAQRETASIWNKYADPALPWSERDAGADKEIAAIKDDDVRKATRTLYDSQRADVRESQRIALDGIHDGLYTGLLDGSLTPTAMVQTPEFGELMRNAPEKADGLVTKAEQLARGGIVTDVAVYGEAMEQLANPDTQAEAAKMNPKALPVSPQHAKEIQTRIDDINKLGVGARSVDQTISQSIAGVVNAKTIKDESERNRIIGDLWESATSIQVDIQRTTGKPATAEQMQAVMDNLMATAVRTPGGWFTSSKPSAFEKLAAAAGGPIPNFMLADLAARIRGRGEKVTTEALAQEYDDWITGTAAAESDADFEGNTFPDG